MAPANLVTFMLKVENFSFGLEAAVSTLFQFSPKNMLLHSSEKHIILLLSVDDQLNFILFIQPMFIDDQHVTLY